MEQLKYNGSLPDIILCDAQLPDGTATTLLSLLKKVKLDKKVVFMVLAREDNRSLLDQAKRLGVDDCFLLPASAQDIHYRLQCITLLKSINKTESVKEFEHFSTSLKIFKRSFDILAATSAIILLLPVLLLITLLIKLDSKGPVLYISKRAGRNYKIFDFYKFRSMKMDADKELSKLTVLNQYQGESSFVKIKNDPRITRLGSFLRNTSLDELPQLLNVLKGDMSLIGNRPLPLYEAEHLTTDEWALRFLAPAGITGLWQVTKRGQTDMTDLERKRLDTHYALSESLELDYQIFLKTFSAMKQKENV